MSTLAVAGLCVGVILIVIFVIWGPDVPRGRGKDGGPDPPVHTSSGGPGGGDGGAGV
jgi:hypothetical protein